MIQLITGPMGCGKSKKLIDFVESIEKVYNGKTMCFKPKSDTRSHFITSRNGKYIDAYEIISFEHILNMMKNENIDNETTIVIDEIQFVETEGLIDFIKYVKFNNIDVISSGLNLTSELTPFESTARFAMYANYVDFIQGECEYCKKPSEVTICKVDKNGDILIGDEIYVQTCYKCHEI